MDDHAYNGTAVLSSLCTNCVHAPDCVLRIAARGRVQYCDLHAVADAPAKVPVNGAPQHDLFSPEAAAMGLCANCANLRSCVLRQPGHVVTHCQHYE